MLLILCLLLRLLYYIILDYTILIGPQPGPLRPPELCPEAADLRGPEGATGVCDKNTPTEKKTRGQFRIRNTKSGAGEQFLPQDCMAKARVKKECVCSQTPAGRRGEGRGGREARAARGNLYNYDNNDNNDNNNDNDNNDDNDNDNDNNDKYINTSNTYGCYCNDSIIIAMICIYIYIYI